MKLLFILTVVALAMLATTATTFASNEYGVLYNKGACIKSNPELARYQNVSGSFVRVNTPNGIKDNKASGHDGWMGCQVN